MNISDESRIHEKIEMDVRSVVQCARGGRACEISSIVILFELFWESGVLVLDMCLFMICCVCSYLAVLSETDTIFCKFKHMEVLWLIFPAPCVTLRNSYHTNFTRRFVLAPFHKPFHRPPNSCEMPPSHRPIMPLISLQSSFSSSSIPHDGSPSPQVVSAD